MKWSIKLARVAGTELRIHLSFLILLLWIAFAFYLLAGAAGTTIGFPFVALVFGSVLLHEVAHVLAARGFGLKTQEINLFAGGGIARLDPPPKNAKQEVLIALAGPLANGLIALGLILYLGYRGTTADVSTLEGPEGAMLVMLAQLAWVNIGLLAINLLPALPLDGGRILRALVARRGNSARATRMAAGLGEGLAFVLGVLGLFFSPLLLCVAWSVYSGAAHEATAASLQNVATDWTVQEAMATQLSALQAHQPLEQAAEVLLRSAQPDFPVLDDHAAVVGMVGREVLLGALRQGKTASAVAEIMRHEPLVVGPDDNLRTIYLKMKREAIPALPVADAHGRLLGVITPQKVEEMALVRSLHSKERETAWRLAHA